MYIELQVTDLIFTVYMHCEPMILLNLHGAKVLACCQISFLRFHISMLTWQSLTSSSHFALGDTWKYTYMYHILSLPDHFIYILHTVVIMQLIVAT